MPGCCCCCNYNLTKCSTHSATAAPCCLLQRDGNIDDFNCGIGSRATKCCAVSSACKWRGQSADKERWTVVRKRLTERESERGVTKEGRTRGAVCVKHCKKQPSYLMVIYSYSYIPTTFGTSYKLIVVVICNCNSCCCCAFFVLSD